MYKHKRYDKNWRFDHKGTQVSTHTDDADEAKRFIKEYKFYAENPIVKSVNDALGCWADDLKKENRFSINHESDLRKISKWFGDFDVTNIPSLAVKEYVNRRTKTVKHTTAEKELRILKGAVNHCHSEDYISHPCNIKIKSSGVICRQRYFEDDEIKAIFSAPILKDKPWGKLLLKMGLGLCARKTAIRTLHRKQIKFESGLIDFNDPSLPRKAKPRAIIKFPSDAFKREIADALSASKSGYVLESPKGPISNYECDTLWLKAYKEAGINSDPNREKACFHTLRHTGAIKMVKSGRVEMKEISVYLGHKSISVTERVYAKYKANFMKESASVMGEAINF